MSRAPRRGSGGLCYRAEGSIWMYKLPGRTAWSQTAPGSVSGLEGHKLTSVPVCRVPCGKRDDLTVRLCHRDDLGPSRVPNARMQTKPEKRPLYSVPEEAAGDDARSLHFTEFSMCMVGNRGPNIAPCWIPEWREPDLMYPNTDSSHFTLNHYLDGQLW